MKRLPKIKSINEFINESIDNEMQLTLMDIFYDFVDKYDLVKIKPPEKYIDKYNLFRYNHDIENMFYPFNETLEEYGEVNEYFNISISLLCKKEDYIEYYNNHRNDGTNAGYESFKQKIAPVVLNKTYPNIFNEI